MIKHLLLSLLFVVTILNTNGQDDPLLQSANDKMNSRNFDGAILDYNQLISIKSNNIEALCGRSEAKINLGNYADALKDADQALSFDATSSRALTLKGEALFNLKDYSNALKLYLLALQQPNPPSMATIGRAKVLNQLGNTKDAYIVLDDAIAHNPKIPDFYYGRGILNTIKEKYAKALQDFDKSLKLNPKYNPFGITLNCGIAYLNLEDDEKAIEYLNKALELDPKSAVAYHTRGLAHYAQEEFKEAVEDFLKSYDFSPNQTTMFNLGMAYYKLNDKGNACLYFHKSCQLGNTNSCKMVIMVCSEGKR